MNSMCIKHVPYSIGISLETYRFIIQLCFKFSNVTYLNLTTQYNNTIYYTHSKSRTRQLIVAMAICQNIEIHENKY